MIEEKLLKFEAEGREFAKFSRSLEQFFLSVSQNNFGNKIPFLQTFNLFTACVNESFKEFFGWKEAGN